MSQIQIEDSYSQFRPKEYLDAYYYKVHVANVVLLKFFAKAYSDVPANSHMLEFSGGPTIHQLISAAPKVKEIHFSDYLKRNLNEVQSWKENSPSAFDWTPFFKKALKLEGEKEITSRLINNREKMLREKITKFLPCNAFLDDPLGYEAREKYDIVSTNFVPCSITSNKFVWRKLIKHITSLLKPGGIFITTSLRDALWWEFGDAKYPGCAVNETHMINTLTRLGFRVPSKQLKILTVPTIRGDYFKGVFCLTAIK
jgi:SAM-dependent methyltransferase